MQLFQIDRLMRPRQGLQRICFKSTETDVSRLKRAAMPSARALR
jgi:hypothetical protein